MPLLYQKDGAWVVGGRKHEGEPLEAVAAHDPGYLQWMYTDRSASLSLEDGAYWALEDTLTRLGLMPQLPGAGRPRS